MSLFNSQHYLDLNEPYLAANVNNYKSNGRDYLTSLSIPEEDAPKPPMAQEESFYINNSAPDINTSGYLAMSPKSGKVKYHPDSPTITKNLDSSPKHKKNVNKKAEIPEEIPMLLKPFNQNGLPIVNGDSDEELNQNSYTDNNYYDSSQKDEEDGVQPEYKNVFASNENYVNVPTTNKSITNPSYTAVNFNTVNERR